MQQNRWNIELFVIFHLYLFIRIEIKWYMDTNMFPMRVWEHFELHEFYECLIIFEQKIFWSSFFHVTSVEKINKWRYNIKNTERVARDSKKDAHSRSLLSELRKTWIISIVNFRRDYISQEGSRETFKNYFNWFKKNNIIYIIGLFGFSRRCMHVLYGR